MALVIDLKPHEKILVGSTVITNDKQRTRLRIDGDAPILREKDTMAEDDANTPSKKLYYTIQSMYVMPSDRALEKISDYFERLTAIKQLAPHISDFLNDVSIEVLQGTYYKALKLVQDLMTFEDNGNEPEPNKPHGDQKLSQAHMEAQLLQQSADQLDNLYKNWETIDDQEIESTVQYNRKLWMVFFDGVNDKSTKVKSNEGLNITTNIINLYNYIYKQSMLIIADGDKEKLTTLIDINREASIALKRF